MCIDFCCQTASKTTFQGNHSPMRPAPSQTPRIKSNCGPFPQTATAASQPAVHSAQIVALHPTSKILRTQNHLQQAQSSGPAASQYQFLLPISQQQQFPRQPPTAPHIHLTRPSHKILLQSSHLTGGDHQAWHPDIGSAYAAGRS